MKKLLSMIGAPILAGVMALGMVTVAPAGVSAQGPATADIDVQNRRCYYKKRQRVRVKWKGKWYRARIIKVRTRPYCRYKIHYIGWSKRWDEWVTASRIRRR